MEDVGMGIRGTNQERSRTGEEDQIARPSRADASCRAPMPGRMHVGQKMSPTERRTGAQAYSHSVTSKVSAVDSAPVRTRLGKAIIHGRDKGSSTRQAD